jgi:hypothetical protein
LAADKRDNTYTRIMNLNERNDKQLFALVNRQRCVRTVNTPILKIDDTTFNNPMTVLDAWADYFEVSEIENVLKKLNTRTILIN